jgi:enoyl-CoA hydratase/carnithine racemase
MKRAFEFENNEIKCYTIGNIGIIKLKSNVFNIVSSLGGSGNVFSIFEIAEQDSNIKLLLILNESCCFSDEEYSEFIKSIAGKEIGSEQEMVRLRQINILNRFIIEMLNFKKLVISCLSGNIVTPFFGASLAADFRFVSEDMIFFLSHLKHNVHPSGALPYFLPKYVGFSKASELLFKDGDINSNQALKLGLVNKILPKENFEKHCIQEALSFAEIDSNVVKSTKYLLNFSKKELDKYFERENDICRIERI